jgi:hypothetical protein
VLIAVSFRAPRGVELSQSHAAEPADQALLL